MGWNSWDCFGAGVTEQDVLANAEYMEKNLKSHGWNIITVDIQWYEPLAHTDRYRRGAVLEMDANGRLLPAGNRFPMSQESHSFKPLADALHAKGLKFGLHLFAEFRVRRSIKTSRFWAAKSMRPTSPTKTPCAAGMATCMASI